MKEMLTIVTTDTQLPFTEDQLQSPISATLIALGQDELVLVAIECHTSKRYLSCPLQGGWGRESWP